MPNNNPNGEQTGAISPQSLRLEDVARIMSGLGPKRVTVEMLLADIENGAPMNRDGTMNLLTYAAWLATNASHHLQ